MKRLGFLIGIGLLISTTSIWGQGATQPTPASHPPAIVYFQTEFFTPQRSMRPSQALALSP